MATSGGGFAASGLLQGFAQSYNQAYQRRTQQDLEQRHQLASFLISAMPNMRPEAQADAGNRLLQIYSTPPNKKLDKKLSDFSTIGQNAFQLGSGQAQQGANAMVQATQQQPLPMGQAPGIQGPPQNQAPAPNIPAPPAYSPFLSPSEHLQQQEDQISGVAGAQEKAKLSAELEHNRQIADSVPGLTPGQRANIMSGKMLIPTGRGQMKTFVGPDGQPVGGFWDPVQKTAEDMSGNVIPNAREWHSTGGFWGKTTPQMAAVGVPPNPLDTGSYPQGIHDPQFKKDVSEYGKKVNDLTLANQMKSNAARGESFAYGRAKYMQQPVMYRDPENGGEPTATYASALQIAGNPSAYTPLVEGDKLMMKNAVFGDIQGAAANLKKAITENPTQFSAAQIAQMTAAMDADPSGGLLHSAITNLVQAGGKDSLSPQQQNVAIAMQQAYENAYALRSVAGMGAGSDELRKAIRATLPGPSSPKDYSLKQLTAFEQQVGRLQKGVTNIPLRSVTPPGETTTPPVKSKSGVTPPPQSKQAGPPTGATHIVPGPDGKNHYTNAQGTVDLGIAP